MRNVAAKMAGGSQKASKSAAAKDTASKVCLLYTSDAADERSSVDLGGRRIIKKKKKGAIQWKRRKQSHNRQYMYSTERGYDGRDECMSH